MRNLKILIPVAISLVAVMIVSFSVALAQENEGGEGNPSKLAVKVAEILGLGATEVDTAIKQAHKEIRDEGLRTKLDAMVEKGMLTQEESDEHLKWIQSKPDGIHFGKMGTHKKWKGHGHFRKPNGRFGHWSKKNELEDYSQKTKDVLPKGEM